MADEPVTAWREPWPTRARRWGRRSRATVTAAAAAVLAGMVGLAAVVVVQGRANDRLTIANIRLNDANARLTGALRRESAANAALAQANQKVQARYDLAVEAIKTFHTGVSEDFLLKEEKFQEMR